MLGPELAAHAAVLAAAGYTVPAMWTRVAADRKHRWLVDAGLGGAEFRPARQGIIDAAAAHRAANAPGNGEFRRVPTPCARRISRRSAIAAERPQPPPAAAAYAATLARLRELKRAGGSSKDIAACALQLEQSKGALRAERKALPQPADPAAAQATYPPPSDVPVDPDGFATAFPCPSVPGGAAGPSGAAAKAFFAERGFVVFRRALSPEACAATRSEIWCSQVTRGRWW